MRFRYLSVKLIIEIASILLIVTVIFTINYPWLNGDIKPLARIYVKDAALEINFIESPLSRDFVQVSLTDKEGDLTIIKNIENKNHMNGYVILSDSTVRLFLHRGAQISDIDTADIQLKSYEK